MSTEVEHARMSPILVFMQTDANYLSSNAVMSIIGGSDAHYWSSWLINRKKRNNCMGLLKYVNTSVSTTAHAAAHAKHPQTHTQFHLSIFLSFWEVSSKEIKLLLFDSSFMLNWCN